MAIPELIKFRQKYPEYQDINDEELASKLAQKYPEAYSDLPKKLDSFKGGATSPANLQAQEDLKKAQQDVSPFGFFKNHPILSSLQGTPELLSGKSLSQRVDEGSPKTEFTPQQIEDYKKKWGQSPDDFNKLNVGDRFKKIGAEAIDMVSSPSNLLLPGITRTVEGIANVGGKVIGKIIEPIKEGFGLSKELKQTAQIVGSASNSAESITRQMGLNADAEVKPLRIALDSEKSTFQDIKDSIDKDIAKQQGLNTEKVQLTKDYHAQLKEDTMNALNKELEKQNVALKGTIGDVTTYLKDEIPSTISNMNEIFGKHIDTIGEAMAKNGKGITQADRFNLLNETVNESNSIGVDTGRAKSLLDRLYSDASKAMEGEKVSTGLLDRNFKPIVNEISGKGNDVIPFRDFINETREFRRILSENKLSGVKGLNDEDIVGALYYKNLNKFMESNVKGYRGLQQDYAPVIRAMKTARRIFKPGDIYSDEQGANLLKRYATGDLTHGKEQLLKDIQAPSKFGEGVGDVTSNIRTIGNKIKSIEDTISNMPSQLGKKFSKELNSIRIEHEAKISRLEKQLEDAKGQSQIKVDNINDKIDELNSASAARIEHVKRISDKLQALKNKGKVAGVLGIVGLGEVGRKGEDIKRLLFR